MASAQEMQRALKAIPSVELLLGTAPFAALAETWRREALVRFLQARLRDYREALRAGTQGALSRDAFIESLPGVWADEWEELCGGGPRRVINGTGVLLHTNLGRSLLSAEAQAAVARAARWPVDLELDLASGKRASRLRRVQQLLCAFSGAEAALAVNNNAAALVLAVDTLARKRRLIVSRGEQVEIGGSFRLPEILERFAGRMVEVGTTNRTRLDDYAKAITRRGDVLLKVHPSNFRQEGYVESVDLAALAQLGKERRCPVIYDLGSGRFDAGAEWLEEPVLEAALAAGPDLITFSGDKVFGGPQAGIALGSGTLVAAMRSNPLARSLRLDKLNLAALEATLAGRLRIDGEVPTRDLLARSRSQIEALADAFVAQMSRPTEAGLVLEKVSSQAASGGGAAAQALWPSCAVRIAREGLPAGQLARRLRRTEPPVLGIVRQEQFYLDFAALGLDELPDLVAALRRALAEKGAGR